MSRNSLNIGCHKVFGFFVLVLLVGFFNAQPSFANESDNPKPFHPRENTIADVEQAFGRAILNNKRAIIVLGANWCHDSLGLVKNFQSDEMRGFLSDHYEIIYVDVGYLEHNLDLMDQFNLPVFIGTPTVLVVDPVSKTLLNKDSLEQWLNAANINVATTKDYFASFTRFEGSDKNIADESAAPQGSDELKRLMVEIDVFEQAQAKRIEKGYSIVGPMLKERVEDGVRSKDFSPNWDALQKLRYNFLSTMQGLRDEAVERTAEGETNISLHYPEIIKLPWE